MNENVSPFRVIIADDHALVRGGISLLVKMITQETVVIECNGYEQTLQVLSEPEPIDLVLLDLLMPGMNSIAGVKHICNTWPDVPVIVVSVREDNKTIQDALRSGAAGYIPKSSTPDITMSAIRLVLSGGVYLPPCMLHLGPQSTSETFISSDYPGLDDSLLPGRNDNLTRRQHEVLDLMTQGKSNKAIASVLGLTPGTIKMHVSRIFKTLEVSNRTEAVTKYSNLHRRLN